MTVSAPRKTRPAPTRHRGQVARAVAPAKTAVETLIELGRELHGEHWIGPTARDLDIARQTIVNWISGKSSLREGPILDALRLLVKSHAQAVARARALPRNSAARDK